MKHVVVAFISLLPYLIVFLLSLVGVDPFICMRLMAMLMFMTWPFIVIGISIAVDKEFKRLQEKNAQTK